LVQALSALGRYLTLKRNQWRSSAVFFRAL